MFLVLEEGDEPTNDNKQCVQSIIPRAYERLNTYDFVADFSSMWNTLKLPAGLKFHHYLYEERRNFSSELDLWLYLQELQQHYFQHGLECEICDSSASSVQSLSLNVPSLKTLFEKLPEVSVSTLCRCHLSTSHPELIGKVRIDVFGNPVVWNAPKDSPLCPVILQGLPPIILPMSTSPVGQQQSNSICTSFASCERIKREGVAGIPAFCSIVRSQCTPSLGDLIFYHHDAMEYRSEPHMFKDTVIATLHCGVDFASFNPLDLAQREAFSGELPSLLSNLWRNRLEYPNRLPINAAFVIEGHQDLPVHSALKSLQRKSNKGNNKCENHTSKELSNKEVIVSKSQSSRTLLNRNKSATDDCERETRKTSKQCNTLQPRGVNDVGTAIVIATTSSKSCVQSNDVSVPSFALKKCVFNKGFCKFEFMLLHTTPFKRSVSWQRLYCI